MPRISSAFVRPCTALLIGGLALATPALAAQSGGGGGSGGSGGSGQGGGADPASVHAPAIAGQTLARHVAAARSHAASNRKPVRTRDPKDPPHCGGASADVPAEGPVRWFVCDIGL